MNDDAALYQVSPRIIERKCGGWLAVTPPGWPLAVGVCGESADAAVDNFKAALRRWAQITLTEDGPDPFAG